MGSAQSNDEGLMKRGEKEQHVYLGQTNERGMSNKTEQKGKSEKSEQQEQIIIHGTVESLDKHKQQMSV